MSVRKTTTDISASAVGTPEGVNQEKGQNQMTRENTDAAPLHEGEGEPVAWRVKDYADGWILFHHEAPARKSGEARNGALVQPLYAAPPPSVEVFGSSSLKGEDTHRDADGAVVAHSTYLSAVGGRMAFRDAYRRCLPVVRAAEALATKWVTQGQKVDGEDFYAAINDVWEAVAKRNGDPLAKDDGAYAVAAVSTAEQPGTSVASEPNPSVEGERLREALAAIVDLGSDGEHSGDRHARCRDIARAALSRKQEPGAPTPGAWIEWSGGPCPVASDVVVHRKYRDGIVGAEDTNVVVGHAGWKWSEHSPDGDIIAYRIVPTPGGEGE